MLNPACLLLCTFNLHLVLVPLPHRVFSCLILIQPHFIDSPSAAHQASQRFGPVAGTIDADMWSKCISRAFREHFPTFNRSENSGCTTASSTPHSRATSATIQEVCTLPWRWATWPLAAVRLWIPVNKSRTSHLRHTRF